MNLSLVLTLASFLAMLAGALIPMGAVPVGFRIALLVVSFSLLIGSVAVAPS